jgi:hypothetical protein
MDFKLQRIREINDLLKKIEDKVANTELSSLEVHLSFLAWSNLYQEYVELMGAK